MHEHTIEIIGVFLAAWFVLSVVLALIIAPRISLRRRDRDEAASYAKVHRWDE